MYKNTFLSLLLLFCAALASAQERIDVGLATKKKPPVEIRFRSMPWDALYQPQPRTDTIKSDVYEHGKLHQGNSAHARSTEKVFPGTQEKQPRIEYHTEGMQSTGTKSGRTAQPGRRPSKPDGAFQ